MSMYMMLILEAAVIILVLHSVSREKVKFNIKTIITMLVNVVFLAILNIYKLDKALTYFTFLTYFLYCMWNLKASFLQAIKYMALCVIEVAFLQFFWALILSFLIFEDINWYGVLANLLTLLCCTLIALWREKRDKKERLGKRNPMVYAAIIFAAMIAMVMLFQIKVLNYFLAEMFVLTVVAIVFMLIFMEWYESYQAKCDELEKELEIQSDYEESYQDLIKDVRVRQHNINNQIATIMGTHYTAKTYEELVKSQEKYCGEILQSNKFNNLLWLGNNVLAGFLYKKFTEMEQHGYTIIYKANVCQLQGAVPMQYLVEMLGILLDNAVEALAQSDYEKNIKVNIIEEQDFYQFEILNLYRNVSFCEIEEWFSFGKSSKGDMRGIGLYRVKEICKEQNCEILCSNEEEGNLNWIKFELIVKKSGDLQKSHSVFVW